MGTFIVLLLQAIIVVSEVVKAILKYMDKKRQQVDDKVKQVHSKYKENKK